MENKPEGPLEQALIASWKRNDYDLIIKPILRQIFGTDESDQSPVVGVSSAPVEDFEVGAGGLLLKSLDVRGSINITSATPLSDDANVLIYILEDLKLAAGVKIYTDLNLTLRARTVYGDLDIVSTRGTDGEPGVTYENKPGARDGDNGPQQTGVGGAGDHASDSPWGDSSTGGGTGPNGHDGEDGDDGQHGGDGTSGGDAGFITLWVERFEAGKARVDVSGGHAGAGGWGQNGGHGGNGSRGGRGGRGGNSSAFHRASAGGPGGKGGDGGDGGNGGSPGNHGLPGDGGFVRLWVPFHQNTRPPSAIYINNSAGTNIDVVARPGKKGLAGSGGSGGSGGRGGEPTPPLHSRGKPGGIGPSGTSGRDGKEYAPVPLQKEAKEYLPDVSIRKHPSAEVEILSPFVNNAEVN